MPRHARMLHAFAVDGVHFVYDANTLTAYTVSSSQCAEFRDLLARRTSSRVYHRCSPPLRRLLNRHTRGDVRNVAFRSYHPRRGQDGFPVVLYGADFHVTNRCNLACVYCYGQQGSEYLNDPVDMTWGVATEAIDYLATHASPRRPFSFLFFGGEPLLAFDLVRAAACYARNAFHKHNREVAFSLTTNGTIVSDDIVTFLRDYNVSLMISIDGPPSAHDALRPMRSGMPSYQAILPNIEWLLRERGGWATSRATICVPNRDMVSVLDHSRRIGFCRSALSAESRGTEHGLSLSNADMLEQYLRLANNIVDTCGVGCVSLPEPFNYLVHKITFGLYGLYPCGAGRGHIAVSPRGRIFPCHRFVGHDDMCVGNVREGVRRDLVRPFWDNSVCDKGACRVCWAWALCMGNCPQRFYEASGVIGKCESTECDLLRGVFEQSIYLTHRLQRDAPRYYASLVDGWQKGGGRRRQRQAGGRSV